MAHGVPEKYIKGGVIVGLVEEKPAEKPAEPKKPTKKTKKAE